MKRLFVLILLTIGLTGTSFAQLGKMQYQDAEQAFSEGKFGEAIQLLNDAERSLGKANPPIMHLRILAMAEMIKADPEKDFEIIDKLRKEVNLFLTHYDGEERLEDKYRDVYIVSKILKDLPLSREQFNKEINDKKQAAFKQEQEKLEREQKFLTYSFIDDYEKGTPLENFMQKYKVKKGMVTKGVDGHERIGMKSGTGRHYSVIIYNGKVAGYETEDKFKSDNYDYEKSKKVLAEKVSFFSKLFGFEPVATESERHKQLPCDCTYVWEMGNKTFAVRSFFWKSTITYYEIDKS